MFKTKKLFGENYEIIVCWGEFVYKINKKFRFCLRFQQLFSDQRLQLIVKC